MEGDVAASPQSWPFFREYAERVLGPKIALLAEEIGHKHEQAIWDELTRRLQAEPGVPGGSADDVRRWLQQSMGLTLSIRAQARFSSAHLSAPLAAPPARAECCGGHGHAHGNGHSHEHTGMDASARTTQQRHTGPIERELPQRPTTTNPLAMAVASFGMKR